MSWLSKLWRGEARFWQIFWLVLIALIVATFLYGNYIASRFMAGMTSYEHFVDQQFYFRVALIPVLLVWLVPVTRGIERATWKWSAWLAAAFIILNLGMAVFDVAYRVHHGHDIQTLNNDFVGDEGV